MTHRLRKNGIGSLFCFVLFCSHFLRKGFEIKLQQKKQNKWNLKDIPDYVITFIPGER